MDSKKACMGKESSVVTEGRALGSSLPEFEETRCGHSGSDTGLRSV